MNLPALKLWIQSIAGELHWEHHVKKWQSQVGAQFSTQTNTYKYGYLIPAYWNFSGGAFAIERWSNNKTEVELGARLDYKWMQAILYESGKKREPIYQFIVPTTSVGVDHHFSQSLKANINSSLAWRSPPMSELFVGGLHHSTATVEIGNEKLTHVTAYDIAVGRGRAVSDKAFYAYLCAVVDWRLKEPLDDDSIRPGILTWDDFLKKHTQYFECEPPEIRELIRGNCKYYSEGVLPPCVPTLAARPRAVITGTDDPGIPSFGKGTS